MGEVPAQLLYDLSDKDVRAVGAWWTKLADIDRKAVADLFDARRDEFFFGADPENPGYPVPVAIGGRFVASDDMAGWTEWHAELFDYLLCHPELVFIDPPVVRTFHICTSHEAAHAVLAAGRIPADFLCPFNAQDCPMRRLLRLAPNEPLQKTGPALQLFALYSPPDDLGG